MRSIFMVLLSVATVVSQFGCSSGAGGAGNEPATGGSGNASGSAGTTSGGSPSGGSGGTATGGSGGTATGGMGGLPNGGWATVTVDAEAGPVTITLPRRDFTFVAAHATYYVATTGSDGADGSIDRPWQTLTYALSQLVAGDVLYVRAGDFAEPLTIDTSGSPGAPIVLSAYPGERVRILQPAGWQAAHPNDGTIVLQAVHDVWIHGFAIEGSLGMADAPAADHYGQNGITLAGGAGEGVRILNNEVSRVQHCGIKEMGHGGVHFVLEGNIVHDVGVTGQDHGFYIPASDAVLRGNVAFRAAGFGIHLYSTPARVHVYDNVTFENAVAGIIVAGPDNVVAHNVVTDNGNSGIMLFRTGCTGNTFVNDVAFANQGGQFSMDDGGGAYTPPSNNTIDYVVVSPASGWAVPSQLAASAGSHVTTADPMLSGSFDFRPGAGSPCLGAAGAVVLNGASASSDIGLFSASLFTDPTWP